MGDVEVKGRNGGGGGGRRWVWAVGALIAVLLATAVTSRTSPKIPLFGFNGKPCDCSVAFLLIYCVFLSFFLFSFFVWLGCGNFGCFVLFFW